MNKEPAQNRSAGNNLELCETVFHMSRMAECMELDHTISVPDEQELFHAIMDWAKEFEQTFDSGGEEYCYALESFAPQKLQETFPFDPTLEEDIAPPDGITGPQM